MFSITLFYRLNAKNTPTLNEFSIQLDVNSKVADNLLVSQCSHSVTSLQPLIIHLTPYFSLGNLLDETEVLDWMTDQKNDESIEEIERDLLFKYIDTKEFLAVIFCKHRLLIPIFKKCIQF